MEKLCRDLFYAIERGDESAVAELLDQGVPLVCYNEFAQTPLGLAVSKGYSDITQLLLERGAPVHGGILSPQQPLYWAVDSNYYEIAALLVQHGASLRAKTRYKNWTPLHQAASGLHLESVLLLLYAGACTTDITEDDETVLHLALHHVNTVDKNLLESLIKHGAPVNACNKDGYTPLHIAIKNSNEESVALLLKCGANPNIYKGLYAPLDYTAKLYHKLGTTKVHEGEKEKVFMRILHMLLDYGARSFLGYTLVISLEPDIVTCLLKKDRQTLIYESEHDVFIKDTKVHVMYRKILLYRLSLMLGQDAPYDLIVIVADSFKRCGESELLFLKKIVKRLLVENQREGISQNQQKCSDYIRDLIRGTIARNSSFEPVSYEMYNALEKIFFVDQKLPREIISYIGDILTQDSASSVKSGLGGSELYKRAFFSVLTDKGTVLKELLRDEKNDFYLDYFDNQGMTLLHYAVLRGNKKLIELLIEHGADPDSYDYAGRTPQLLAWHVQRYDLVLYFSNLVLAQRTPLACLIAAVIAGNLQKVYQLVQVKGLITKKDETGKTSLHYAALCGYYPVLALLLRYGAEVKVRDNDNQRAHEIARREGNKSLVPYLLDRQQQLFYGAQQGNYTLVKEALAQGARANVTAPDDNNYSPLQYAFMLIAGNFSKRVPRIIGLLMENGARYYG